MNSFRLYLIDRSTRERNALAPGRHLLPAADPCVLELQSADRTALRLHRNGRLLSPRETERFALLPDPEGLCRLEVFDVQERLLARWQLEVPARTLPDASLLPSLAIFAREAQARPPRPDSTLETLLSLPFFAPETVSASLDDLHARAFEAQLAAAMKALHKVCAHPRRNLVIEQRVVPVDRARRIPPAAFAHLASRPELWQSRTAVSLTPSRVLTELPEETLELYENRMVATLIRRLQRYLAHRLSEVEHACYQIDAVHASLFNGYRYNRFRNERFNRLWNAGERFHERRGEALELRKDVVDLAADVSSCLDSVLFQALARTPDIASPVKPTNILTMAPDYRKLLELWEALDALLRRPAERVVSNVTSTDPVQDYAAYLHAAVLLALRWTGFEATTRTPGDPPAPLAGRPLLRWEHWWAHLEAPEAGSGRIRLHLLRGPATPDALASRDADDRKARRREEGEADRKGERRVRSGADAPRPHETIPWQTLKERAAGTQTPPAGAAAPPHYLQLTFVPLLRALYGTRGELEKDVEALYRTPLALPGRPATEGREPRRRRQVSSAPAPMRALLLAHPTDPRSRPRGDDGPCIGEDVPPALVRRLLTLGENFVTVEEYRSFVHSSEAPERPAGDAASPERTGLLPVSPLELNSLERLQRIIRFYTLGRDLMDGLGPLCCPVCSKPLDLPARGSTEGECTACDAKWSVRVCDACGGRIPKLEPLKMRLSSEDLEASYAVHAIAREQQLGRDQLAAMCESNRIAASGRINVICPHCGACPGDRQDRSQCRRCAARGQGAQGVAAESG
jgi:hypothetical protein